MSIENHINTLKEKAQGIERRLCETEEKLDADQIVVLAEKLSKYIQSMDYLLNIKMVRDENKKIKAATPAQILQAAK